MIWRKLFGGSETPTEPTSPASAETDVDWVPVNALEEQMAQIPSSVEAQFAFARMLIESDLLLAIPASTEHKDKGARVLEEDEDHQVIMVDDNRGGSAVAAFTSETRLAEAFGEGAPYIALNGRAALETVRAQGVIINPGCTSIYVLYNPDTIERILSGNI